jgi:Fe-Mn family superoxide dismutase
MPFKLPELTYKHDALEPVIDTQTMQVHHGKHHQAYVDNLNKALEGAPQLADWTVDDLVKKLPELPEAIRMAVRNHGGGHYNHSLFWQSMGPGKGGEPTGALAAAITAAFGSFTTFKTKFQDAGLKRFGSGWVWLVQTKEGKLDVVSTANQDCPLTDGQYPLLGNDVWEHAYYLKYQNRRAEYLEHWWQVVDWQAVGQRHAKVAPAAK